MKVKDTDGVIYKFYDYQIGKPHSDLVINEKKAFRIATPRGDITVYADYWAKLSRRNKIKDWIFRILYCLFCLVPQAILIVCAICVAIAIYVFCINFSGFCGLEIHQMATLVSNTFLSSYKRFSHSLGDM